MSSQERRRIRAKIPLRRKRKNGWPNKVMLPVQISRQKFSGFHHPQITGISIAVSFPQEGRLAIVTDVGSGMRWTRRVLLTRALSSRTVKSCGPDASTLASSFAERQFREATVTNKPDHRGEYEGTR